MRFHVILHVALGHAEGMCLMAPYSFHYGSIYIVHVCSCQDCDRVQLMHVLLCCLQSHLDSIAQTRSLSAALTCLLQRMMPSFCQHTPFPLLAGPATVQNGIIFTVYTDSAKVNCRLCEPVNMLTAENRNEPLQHVQCTHLALYMRCL